MTGHPPTRVLATCLAVLQVVQMIQGFVQRILYLNEGSTHLNQAVFTVSSGFWGMWNTLGLVLAFGLVLSCDRRLIPGLMFVLWIGLTPLTSIDRWSFDLTIQVSYAVWMLLDLVYVGLIAAVAVVQTERPLPTVGAVLVASVLLAASFGMRLAEVEVDAAFIVVSLLRNLALTLGFVWMALTARAPDRSHLGWPLVLLGVLPLMRIWLALDTRLQQGSYGGADPWVLTRSAGTEVVLFGLVLVGFWGVSRRGVDTVPVTVGLLVNGGLTVATGLLAWLVSTDFRWGRDHGGIFLILAGVTVLSGLGVLFLQVRTLRSLTVHLDAPRLTMRADTTLGLYGMTVVMTVVVFGLVLISGGRDPVTGALALLLSLGLVFIALAALAMWVFLCLGLARRLDQSPDASEVESGPRTLGT